MKKPNFKIETISENNFVVLSQEELKEVNGAYNEEAAQFTSISNDHDKGGFCSISNDTDDAVEA
jgi:hypothetical protein